MEYKHGPDSLEQEGVPRGSITKFHWKSQFYRKETVRDYWVYVPSQYNETNPLGLMVVNDGIFTLIIQLPFAFQLFLTTQYTKKESHS